MGIDRALHLYARRSMTLGNELKLLARRPSGGMDDSAVHGPYLKSPPPPTPNTHNSKARGPTTAKYRRISRIPVTGQATATLRGCGGPRCGRQETWQGVGGGDSARTTSVGCAGVGGGGWCLNRNNTNIRPHGPRLHLRERTCAKSRRRVVVSTPAVSIGVCG